MEELVSNFYVAEGEEWLINDEVNVNFRDDQKKCALLVAVIRAWGSKTSVACGGRFSKKTPEDEWSFSYKWPSDCGGCVSAQRLLRKVFGSLDRFHALPFVAFEGDRVYRYRFDLLKMYAEKGEEAVKQKMIEIQEEEARLEREKERREREKKLAKNQGKLDEMLGGVSLSSPLRHFLLGIMAEKAIENLKVVDPDFAVAQTSRSEWGGSGGIGYYDQIRVYYHGQTSIQEWQWRDRWSASNDRPSLQVHGIGQVKLEVAKDDKVEVSVELINNKYSNRTAVYFFKKASPPAIPSLDENARRAFLDKLCRCKDNLVRESKLLWRLKPQMLADYSGLSVIPSGSPAYVNYREPKIKQLVSRPEWGVAAFVLEEQIDHRGSDPQMRYELNLVTPADCRQVLEDHAYEKREGSALISIIDLQPGRIEINTRSGKRVIKI